MTSISFHLQVNSIKHTLDHPPWTKHYLLKWVGTNMLHQVPSATWLPPKRKKHWMENQPYHWGMRDSHSIHSLCLHLSILKSSKVELRYFDTCVFSYDAKLCCQFCFFPRRTSLQATTSPNKNMEQIFFSVVQLRNPGHCEKERQTRNSAVSSSKLYTYLLSCQVDIRRFCQRVLFSVKHVFFQLFFKSIPVNNRDLSSFKNHDLLIGDCEHSQGVKGLVILKAPLIG